MSGDLHLKPVTDEHGSVDWVLFETGHYSTPIRIIPGYVMQRFARQIADHYVTITCPHCGDESEQTLPLLPEYCCGNCDEPFTPEVAR